MTCALCSQPNCSHVDADWLGTNPFRSGYSGSDSAGRDGRPICAMKLLLPMIAKMGERAVRDILFSKSEERDTCIIAAPPYNSKGYASRYIEGKYYYLHRISWCLDRKQEIPAGMFICHACDNPSCINPDHLWVGSARDNNRDCVNKGRARFVGQPGEKHWNAILTRQMARDIFCDSREPKEVAAIYGIGADTVVEIRGRRCWGHATGDLPDPVSKRFGNGFCRRGHDVTKPGAVTARGGHRRCRACATDARKRRKLSKVGNGAPSQLEPR